MTVDHVAPLAGADDITLVVVKLPEVSAPSELVFKITLGSTTTNTGWIKVATP